MENTRNLRLIVSDVDGTLTSFDKPVNCDISTTLKRFEDLEIRIALSSGKHLPYLRELAKNLGVRHPIIIAENGCVIANETNNKETWLVQRSPEIQMIRMTILDKFPDAIWEQPNQVEFTFSAKTSALKQEVISYSKEVIGQYRNSVHMYESAGCIDVLPNGIDKGIGLAEIKKICSFKRAEVAVIGDDDNDISMFNEAGLSLIIGTKISYPDASKFNTIRDALDFLSKYIFYR